MQFTVQTAGSSFSKTIAKHEAVEISAAYRLQQNYPNPFNPTTKIRFDLGRDARVELKVYDVLGREVSQVVSGDRPGGAHEVLFDGTDLSSGVYYYRLVVTPLDGQSSTFIQTRKLMLAK